MKIIHVHSWNDFENEIKQIAQLTQFDEVKIPLKVLYRGQADAEWHLKTTLERVMGNQVGLQSYYSLMRRIKSRIETFTEKNWKLPTENEYHKWLRDSNYRSIPPGYEFMVYLRHHGFPSPLLDWSMSPFIAAYFAFRDYSNNSDSVAIFAYCEMPNEAKYVSDTHANIESLPSDIRTDQRHFLQQSTYTICSKVENKERYYARHEDVFNQGETSQDILWKFILPSSERKQVLRMLDTYNINAYSIFQSEDSLMETVFLREYSQFL